MLMLMAILNSCGSGLHIPKDEAKPIVISLSDTFYNGCHASKYSDLRPSILELFNISDDSTYQVVHFSFVDHKHLRLVAIDSVNPENKKEWVFKGKFKKPGYFKIKLYNYSFFIPFLYEQHVYDKIRIGLTVDNSLVIRNDTDKSVAINLNGKKGGPTLINSDTFFFKAVNNSAQNRF